MEKSYKIQQRNYENCDATSHRVWPHFEVIEAHITELRVKRTQDTAKKIQPRRKLGFK